MSSYHREPARAFRGLTSLFVLVALAATVFPGLATAQADHLLISEIVVKTRSPVSTFGSPFIEIVNPTGGAIDMSDVYLTDGTTAPTAFYYNLPLMSPDTDNPGGGNGGDFHARFPAGFSLAAGDTLVISLNGSTEYAAAYGRDPDFELFEDAVAPDTVPELVEAFPGGINAGLGGGGNVPVLSDLAESLVLYTWDGSSDLVQDVDYLMWGTNNAVRINKSGVTIGAGTYLPDTPEASQDPAGAAGPGFGASLRRIGAGEGNEIAAAGNGLTGHDETSEDQSATWAGMAGSDPGTGVGSPAPSAPIVTLAETSPAAPRENDMVTLQLTLATYGSVTGVTFSWTVDGGAVQTAAGADQGNGLWAAQVPGQLEGTVVNWWASATNDGGGQVLYPASAPTYYETWTTGAGVVPGDGPTKLLLTEIATLGSEQEFIEIYNPSTEDVDLSDYYLTDANYTAGNQHYYRIAEGNPDDTTIGGGVFNDFHGRFPDGYTIAAGDTITIAVPGSTAFEGSFGFKPDLELYEDDGAPDNVPDFRWVFGDAGNNSIVGGTTPSLTNGAETVILYHWDGLADFVTDIDVFAWKDPNESTTVNHYFDKSGVTIGGHTYLDEVGTNDNLAFNVMNEFGNSYQRTGDEGSQTPTGSNGVDGRDETSENFRNTFAMLPYDPAGPGDLPDPEPEKLLVTQVCTTPTAGEFIEIHNPAGYDVPLGRYFLTDAIYAPGNTFYWRIAEGNPSQASVGGGDFGDFHARFPDDYSIASGDTITVSVAGSDAFEATYGYLPDFELFEDGPEADDVPELMFVFGDAANNSITGNTDPGLTDSAETVILYNWQAGADKVVDIDVFFWRDATSTTTDILFDKSGVTVGAHTYANDTPVANQTPFGTEHTDGNAYRRTDGSEGTQTPTGSNGVGGRDETSENFDGTFAMQAAEPAMPAPPPNPDDYPPKLLITEVAILGTDQEFVEIHNPNDEDVDLGDYYLTDAIYNTGGQYYWRIAEGNPQQSTVGGGAFTDFHARFPDGATIPAEGTLVVSIAGSDAFDTAFGFLPDYELYEDGDAPDDVPDMRYIFGDDTTNSIIDWTDTSDFRNPGLSNAGETVILYHWVEGEDKVVDIDVVTWFIDGSSSIFFDKSGVTIGSHSYLDEAGTSAALAMPEQPPFGFSYTRTDPDESTQTPTGSNGVLGTDETSENCPEAFEILAYSPGEFDGGGGEGPDDEIIVADLWVPARTFLPREGEKFPVLFVSRPKAEAETKLRIFDLEGRVVLTIYDSQFANDPPDDLEDRRNTFYWDGRDQFYEYVRGGMYVVHLSVVDLETGEETTKTAPVVVGTRLSN